MTKKVVRKVLFWGVVSVFLTAAIVAAAEVLRIITCWVFGLGGIRAVIGLFLETALITAIVVYASGRVWPPVTKNSAHIDVLLKRKILKFK
jgi:hypothetical protein